MFVILWEFEVKQLSTERFQSVYGPGGAWVQLFRSDSHYRMTRLLRDTARPNFYYTLDFWDTESAYENFRRANREAYLSLDQLTEGLTLSERCLGTFTQSESSPPIS